MASECEHTQAEPAPARWTELLLAEQSPLKRAETRRKLEQDPALRVSAEVESLASLRAVAAGQASLPPAFAMVTAHVLELL